MGIALGAGLCAQESAPRDLGRVVFIGDSITHGVGAASYRWALHKILVDNGVKFEVIGVTEGNRYADQGVAPGVKYRGVAFNNRHCSVTSERAYEISGRKHPSLRLGASDIHDWLGLNAAYTGEYKLPAGAPPDTCFILIGTNDILGDFDGCFDRPEIMQRLKRALLDAESGDMSVIVAAIRRANPQARIIVLTIPTWEYHEKNDRASAYAAVREYNRALAEWAKAQGVLCVDVFEILADAACSEMPGKGVADFFYFEEGLHLHPSTQGDLLMAGAVARAMGYHARTAGLARPLRCFPAEERMLRPGESARLRLPQHGVIDFSILTAVGDGAANGWEQHKGLRLDFCCGSLTISESRIMWSDSTTLYSGDMSANREPIRIACVREQPEQGIAGGFYVWLGELLIGEALPMSITEDMPVDALILTNTLGLPIRFNIANESPR